MISSLLLITALSGLPTESAPEASVQTAKKVIAAEAQTGTLLFSKGDCVVVKVFSKSSYTHVAAIVVEDEKIVVYDSMSGIGVRKLSLEEYLRDQCPDDHIIYHPATAFTKEQSATFKNHLEEELGRPYSYAHYVTGRRAKGLHCAEYVTDALQECDIIHAKHPSRVSPGSLLKGVSQHDIYKSSEIVKLDDVPIIAGKGRNRCHQWWLNTKAGCLRGNRKMKRWFACQ